MRLSDGPAGSPSRPRSNRGPTSLSPRSRRSAGITNTAVPTIADSGLPGSPNTSVLPRRPNHSGLPGLIRTRQKTSSTPQASNAGLTWSCGPTETPPETTRMSPSRPRSTASRVASKSSATGGWWTTCAPTAETIDVTTSELDS